MFNVKSALTSDTATLLEFLHTYYHGRDSLNMTIVCILAKALLLFVGFCRIHTML